MRPIPELSEQSSPIASTRPGLPGWVRGLAREPLVHFFIAGALLFAGASTFKALQHPVVHIDAQELTQLAAYWEAQMQRPPSPDEMKGIIRERIDEEILAREALRLGLDRNDMIVRRRLAQKMSFASDDTTAAKEPDEATLKAWFAAHKDHYLEPPHVSFRQMFFSQDRSRSEAEVTARTALARLEEGENYVRGEPFLLPLAYGDASTAELLRDYGEGFVDALVKAPVGRWVGPVQSAFGYHLIRVEARDAARSQSFEQVRGDVRDAWIQEQRKAGNAKFMSRLRDRYKVVVDGVETLPGH